MELRRSRRLAGLPPYDPQEEEIPTSLYYKKNPGADGGILKNQYEWAAFVFIAFILPVYYFAAFK